MDERALTAKARKDMENLTDTLRELATRGLWVKTELKIQTTVSDCKGTRPVEWYGYVIVERREEIQ